jgi:predicted RNase H-like nuclease
MSEGWTRLGYKLATCNATSPDKALIEVYPHPALLFLLHADRRIQYKVSKSGTYWPGTTVRLRIERLLEQIQKILSGLRSEIGGIDVVLPSPGEISTLSALKPYEDRIDALVCCWVGTKYLAGQAEPFGDDDSAIWCPKQVAAGDSKQPRAWSC